MRCASFRRRATAGRVSGQGACKGPDEGSAQTYPKEALLHELEVDEGDAHMPHNVAVLWIQLDAVVGAVAQENVAVLLLVALVDAVNSAPRPCELLERTGMGARDARLTW